VNLERTVAFLSRHAGDVRDECGDLVATQGEPLAYLGCHPGDAVSLRIPGAARDEDPHDD
jgi:hypothetical protein